MNNLRIAVLISGAGSTLQNLIQLNQRGQLPVDFQLVISSHAKAGGIAYATDSGIPFDVVSRKNFSEQLAHSDRIFSRCRQRDVQLVVMAGYLEHLLIPDDYTHRVINIHPALIPAFSGKGFYGLRVHQAALDYGVKLSGCTVHFVDNEYDHGPIIAQRACPVLDGDTPESLQHRVGQLERQLYPETIAAIAREQVKIVGRKVLLRAMV